jgi:hypothetical protein
VNSRQLGLFEAEVRSILEGQRPQRVYVLYFDAVVHTVETFEAGYARSLGSDTGQVHFRKVQQFEQRID